MKKDFNNFFNLDLKKSIDNSTDDVEGVFTGKLVTYGNVDRQNEVIDNTAFANVQDKTYPLLFDHNYQEGIGYFKVTGNNEQQLTIEGHFNLENEQSKDIYSQVKFGTYTNLSVGLRVLDYYFDSNDILHITKAELLEGSITPVPANSLATIDVIKSLKIDDKNDTSTKENELMENKKNTVDNKQQQDNLSQVVKILSDTVAKGFEEMTNKLNELHDAPASEAPEHDNVQVNKSFKVDNNKNLNDYLKSDQAVKDYYDVISKSYQEGLSGNVTPAWKQTLVNKDFNFQNQAGTAIDLPTQVVKKIEQKIQNHQLYQYFNKMVGIDHYTFLLGTSADGAATHKPGTTKKNSTETLQQLDVNADYVYQYIEADRKMMTDSNTAAITVQWLVGKLADAIISYIEEAAIKGQTDNTSIQPVLKSKLLAQPADFGGATSGAATLEDVSKAINFVANKANTNNIVVIGSNTTLSALRYSKDKNGAYLLNSAFSEPNKLLGYTTVDIDLGDQVVVLANSAYSILQKTDSIESFTNFKLDTNKNQFLSEVLVGGALTTLYGAAVVGTASASAVH